MRLRNARESMMHSNKMIVALALGFALGGCQSSAKTTPAKEASPVADLAGGSISGRIEPGEAAAPALHVCAISTDGRHVGCVMTSARQAQYRIEGLAAGEYAVYGWTRTGDKRVLRSLELRMCIKAPCPLGPPVVVALAAGESYDRAHLNDIATSFPGMPAEPTD